MKDLKITQLIREETKRQSDTLDLIASENIISRGVAEALGSSFVNKYAEGYPSARYYGGNSVADKLENLVRQRALKLFRLSPKKWSVNVQPYSGSPANIAVYLAVVPLGEKIMGLKLDMGGHLTHGHKVSATGKLWRQVGYAVHKKTGRLDYKALLALARREKPKLVVAGYTAYAGKIDFKKFRKIADAAGAILMIDMSHIAGLVAGGAYPTPFPHADIVTTTTHKTLRGPRAAIIFSRKEFSKQIDKAVFPGFQGGPHLNQIAAVGVALFEAKEPSFKRYAKQVVKNSKTLALELQKMGWKIIGEGTASHLFLVDTASRGVGGKDAGDILEKAGIIVNKNAIPYDLRSPVDPSGIRIGTPAITSRGMRQPQMKTIARLIDGALSGARGAQLIKREVLALCKKFPAKR